MPDIEKGMKTFGWIYEKACDAAMEMDRKLFSLLGADLTILETVIDGAPKCKMLMKMKG